MWDSDAFNKTYKNNLYHVGCCVCRDKHMWGLESVLMLSRDIETGNSACNVSLPSPTWTLHYHYQWHSTFPYMEATFPPWHSKYPQLSTYLWWTPHIASLFSGVKKMTAKAAKTVKYGASVDGISTAEPDQYAKRFLAFMGDAIEWSLTWYKMTSLEKPKPSYFSNFIQCF